MSTEITPEIVRELLHYDPDTGIFTWRERGPEWFKVDSVRNSWNRRYAGTRAGSVHDNSRGYLRRGIKLLGRVRHEHHLAWMYMTNEPLPPEMDHKDHDGTNNRWKNLRASTCTANNRNKSMQMNNTSGVTGVSWKKSTGKWVAHGNFDAKRKHLGCFDSIDEAARAVAAFRKKHEYDPSHGETLAPYHTS